MYLLNLRKMGLCLSLIVGIAHQNALAADQEKETAKRTNHIMTVVQSEEAHTGARFMAHLLTDPIEISRQAVHSTSSSWLTLADTLRFGTIAYNLYYLFGSSHDLTLERAFELLHYVGDAGERIAVSFDYTGSLRSAMNILQFGGVAGYIGVRAYKRFWAAQEKQS